MPARMTVLGSGLLCIEWSPFDCLSKIGAFARMLMRSPLSKSRYPLKTYPANCNIRIRMHPFWPLFPQRLKWSLFLLKAPSSESNQWKLPICKLPSLCFHQSKTSNPTKCSKWSYQWAKPFSCQTFHKIYPNTNWQRPKTSKRSMGPKPLWKALVHYLQFQVWWHPLNKKARMCQTYWRTIEHPCSRFQRNRIWAFWTSPWLFRPWPVFYLRELPAHLRLMRTQWQSWDDFGWFFFFRQFPPWVIRLFSDRLWKGGFPWHKWGRRCWQQDQRLQPHMKWFCTPRFYQTWV